MNRFREEFAGQASTPDAPPAGVDYTSNRAAGAVNSVEVNSADGWPAGRERGAVSNVLIPP
jgi:hypothetical protein